MEIVGATRMIFGAPKLYIPCPIARGDYRIVNPGGRIGFEGEHGFAPVVDEDITDPRREPAQGSTRMLHRKIDAKISRVEGPKVDDLGSERIDDLQRLSAADFDGTPLASGNFVYGRHASPLRLL
jgi:hypothetical protein